MNSSLLSFPIAYDHKRNSVASLFNGMPELKQTTSSFSRRTSKGFMYSFISVFITACTSYSVLRICDLRKFISITASIQITQIIKCFGVLCSEQFKYHFVTVSLFVLNAFVQPDVFASWFMVCFPLINSNV